MLAYRVITVTAAVAGMSECACVRGPERGWRAEKSKRKEARTQMLTIFLSGCSGYGRFLGFCYFHFFSPEF